MLVGKGKEITDDMFEFSDSDDGDVQESAKQAAAVGYSVAESLREEYLHCMRLCCYCFQRLGVTLARTDGEVVSSRSNESVLAGLLVAVRSFCRLEAVSSFHATSFLPYTISGENIFRLVAKSRHPPPLPWA